MSPRIVVALSWLLVAAPLASALGPWPMEAGDAARSGTVSAPLPTSSVELAWESAAGVQFTGLFVAADGSIAAIGDPVAVFEPDGKLRWSTRTIGADQKVYRARGGAQLSDGTIVTVGHPALSNAAVVGYDPKDGTQKFETRDIGRKCDSIEDNPIAVAADDSFYVGGCEPSLFAFAKDGSLKWQYAGDTERVALGGSNVYADVEDFKAADGSTVESGIAAFAQADGKPLWVTPGDVRLDPIVGEDGTIFAILDNQATALSPTDGAKKWQAQVPRAYAMAIAPNGTLAVASTSVVAWLDPADGTLLGVSPTKDGSRFLVGNGVHVKSYGASVSGVDPTGKALWEITAPSNVQSNLAVGADGTLYFAVDGKLLAYRGEGGSAAPPASEDDETPTPPPGGPTPTRPNDASETPAPAAWLVAIAALAAALVARRR